MSLRCSLLGHNYGEAEIEREREEQGSEVVVTVREFEECERCGERKVVTENKEVTALETPASESRTGTPASGSDTEPVESDPAPSVNFGAGDAEVMAGSADGDDAEVMTDTTDSAGPSGTDHGQPASGNASQPTDTTAPTVDNEFEAQSAAEDDGVILDDSDDEDSGAGASAGMSASASDTDDRTSGEWPDADTTHPADADEGGFTEWPDVGREDEGFDAQPGGDDAEVEFGGGLTPESGPQVDEDESEEVEFVNAEGDTLQARDNETNDSDLSAGITVGSEAPSMSGPSDDPDVDSEFVCPECSFREGASGSSHRAGDICPECRKGYLAQE